MVTDTTLQIKAILNNTQSVFKSEAICKIKLITSSYYNTDPYTMNTQPCSRTGSRLSGSYRDLKRFLLASHQRSLTSASSSTSGFQSEVREDCPVVPRNNFFYQLEVGRPKTVLKTLYILQNLYIWNSDVTQRYTVRCD